MRQWLQKQNKKAQSFARRPNKTHRPRPLRYLYAISLRILTLSDIDLLWFLFVSSMQIALRQQHPNDAEWNVRQSTQHSNTVWQKENFFCLKLDDFNQK